MTQAGTALAKLSPKQARAYTVNNWDWRISAYDHCVLIADRTGLMLEVHVDDIKILGLDVQAIRDFKSQLS